MSTTENLAQPTKYIRGKQVFVNEAITAATLVVKDGKISEILPFHAQIDSKDITEIPDHCILLPGIVDSHVHVNEPGRTDWEGFYTATQAAAVGGVTCLSDMPLNSIPPTTTLKHFEEKIHAASPQCWVDVGFIGGVIPDNEGELHSLLKRGLFGFKCFLIHSGVDEFPAVNEKQVLTALEQLKDKKTFLMFHAELELDEKELASESKKSSDPAEYTTFLESRPRLMENKAIELVISLAKKTGVHCHIVHLSSSDALEMVKKAKSEGVPLSVETCFHYLFFDAEEIPNAQPRYKCCPPIREKSNRDKLWEGLQSGIIDFVVSDHSPCTPDLKAKEGGSYMSSWGGISGLQFGISVLYTELLRRKVEDPFAKITQWLSYNTSKFLRLDDRKGKIKAGLDADLIIFDPTESFVVDSSTNYFKNKLSAYNGEKLQGRVKQTMVRGSIVYDGKEFSKAPLGNLVFSPQ